MTIQIQIIIYIIRIIWKTIKNLWISINNITDNEPKINIPKLKEEKTEKSFIDTIIDFFKPTKSENIKLNTNDELSNIRGGYINLLKLFK